MRLNRFLARAGVSSRRAADELITAGRVAVNGAVVRELATTVDPDADTVEFDGRRVELPSTRTYVALNKPVGCVVTLSDPQGRPTVADLIADVGAAVVPVGRLDARTEGLLILTDDGELAHRVTHPSFELDKVYEVVARGVLSEESRRRLESGVELDGRVTSPARVTVRSTARHTTVATIVIHEGRKRQVRRMFEAVGHPVRALRRLSVGPIELGDLRPGTWRRLAEAEVHALQRAVGLADADPPEAE
jgi:23S rRNA pseudouridine2605 synthase